MAGHAAQGVDGFHYARVAGDLSAPAPRVLLFPPGARQFRRESGYRTQVDGAPVPMKR